jgi:hypothetical protein
MRSKLALSALVAASVVSATTPASAVEGAPDSGPQNPIR